MKIKIYPTVSPTSVLEQAQFLAETIGGEVASSIQPETVDVAIFFGPPNQAMDQIRKIITAKRKICYWVLEGPPMRYGRYVARVVGCDVSVAPSKAVQRFAEEGDIYIDMIIPHEIRVSPVDVKKERRGIYIGGNYPRKFMQWALDTYNLLSHVLDVYYRAEIPDQFAKPFNDILESKGIKRLEKMDKVKLSEFIAGYYTFASLSSGEGFGLFQREALALGLNLVTVETDAFWDILSHPCVYIVKPTATILVSGNRNDVYEEYRSWNPNEYAEVFMKSLERPCNEPLKYEPHYRKFKLLVQ